MLLQESIRKVAFLCVVANGSPPLWRNFSVLTYSFNVNLPNVEMAGWDKQGSITLSFID